MWSYSMWLRETLYEINDMHIYAEKLVERARRISYIT